MSSSPPIWDCRWPDPVALKVASDRLLRNRSLEDTALNRKMNIRVQIEPPKDSETPIRAILVTPWGVERVYWSNPTLESPEVKHAVPLELDDEGRVEAGIGLLLNDEGRQVPVLTAWEPEVGHHFIETLLHSVKNFSSADEAIATALGEKAPPSAQRSVMDHLNHKVRRRDLLEIFRR